jgi:hypothetical protein
MSVRPFKMLELGFSAPGDLQPHYIFKLRFRSRTTFAPIFLWGILCAGPYAQVQKKWKSGISKRTCRPNWSDEKAHFFLDRHLFSCKQEEQLHLKSYLGKDMPPIYWMMPKILSFLGLIVVFTGTPTSHSSGALCSVHGRIQPRNTHFLVAINRYGLLLLT